MQQSRLASTGNQSPMPGRGISCDHNSNSNSNSNKAIMPFLVL
jgi:hypothetical protein